MVIYWAVLLIAPMLAVVLAGLCYLPGKAFVVSLLVVAGLILSGVLL